MKADICDCRGKGSLYPEQHAFGCPMRDALLTTKRAVPSLREAVGALMYDGSRKPYAHPDRDGHYIMVPLKTPLGAPTHLWDDLRAALASEGTPAQTWVPTPQTGGWLPGGNPRDFEGTPSGEGLREALRDWLDEEIDGPMSDSSVRLAAIAQNWLATTGSDSPKRLWIDCDDEDCIRGLGHPDKHANRFGEWPSPSAPASETEREGR